VHHWWLGWLHLASGIGDYVVDNCEYFVGSLEDYGSVVVKTFFRSQDRDLGLQVSRPRPTPWPSGLETETWTK